MDMLLGIVLKLIVNDYYYKCIWVYFNKCYINIIKTSLFSINSNVLMYRCRLFLNVIFILIESKFYQND